MAKAGVTRDVKSRSGGIVLLFVASSIALSGRSWTFCSLPSTRTFSSRSVSKVQVRFMGMDKNKDGVISPEEFRSGMKGAVEKGKFDLMDFFGSVGLNEDEISTVFTVVGESGRQRLWGAMQADLDLGTVKKGFPHFNSELNEILPGLPRFNSGFFQLDKDGDGKISDDEFQEGIDMICEKAKVDSDEFFKRIGTSQDNLSKLFTALDDMARVKLWQALVRDVDMKNTKDFPLFNAEVRIKLAEEKKKQSDKTALSLLLDNFLR